MAESVCSLFLEDEVCKKSDQISYTFGLVLDNFEFVSSDDDEEEEQADRLRRGTVKVAWHPEGVETVEEEDKVMLTDRSLMPGDVVRRMIKGQNSPRGFVQDTYVKCHVHIKGTDKFIFNVDSKDLTPLQGYELDQGEVTMDSWVGRLEAINQKIRVMFPDGAKCEMMDSDLSMLERADPDVAQDSEFSFDGCFFKGQIFTGTMGHMQDVKWLHQTKLHNPRIARRRSKRPICVQVEEVYVNSVEVNWICRGFTEVDNSMNKMDHPPSEITRKDLDKIFCLSSFNHSSIQIGDKCKYVIKDTDVLLETPPKGNIIPDIVTWSNSSDIKQTSPQYSKSDFDTSSQNGALKNSDDISNDIKSSDPSSDKDTLSKGADNSSHSLKEANMEVDDQNTECVLENCCDEESENDESSEEDDDVIESGVISSEEEAEKLKKVQNFRPKRKPGARKHYIAKRISVSTPKQLVKFNTNLVDVNAGSEVAVEICYTFSCANVMWQNGQEECGIPSPELFPIHHLDELEFFPGDFVVESKETSDVGQSDYGVVVSCDHLARTCLVKWMKTVDITKGEKPEDDVDPAEVSVYDIKDHPDFKFRPGHTVIRVSEPVNVTENTPAVGQIYRLDPQGAMYVKWPTGDITRCYPQELYIVGDEMSEFDSDSEMESTDEEDDEEEGSDASWETENEEEVEDTDTTASTPAVTPSENKDVSSKVWGPLSSKKVMFDNLLERAQTALKKLEKIFQDAKYGLQNPEQCLVDILSIYRKCRDVEKVLRSSYFEDTILTDLIDEVKSKLRRVKTDRINKHLLQVFEQRRPKGHCEGQDGISDNKEECNKHFENTNNDVDMKVCDTATVTRESPVPALSNPAVVESQMNDSDACQVTESSVPQTTDSKINSGDNQKPVDVEGNDQKSIDDDATGSNKGNSSSEESRQQNVNGGACCPESDKASQTEDENIVLCSKICKQLRQKMTKLQEEMEEKCKAQLPPTTKEDAAAENVEDMMDREKMDIEAFKLNVEQTVAQILEEEITNREMEVVSEASPKSSQDDSQTAADASVEESKETPEPGKEEDVQQIDETYRGGFYLEDEVSPSHKFYSKDSEGYSKSFLSTVRKEMKLLNTSLPKGILVKTYEDRMELFSVMIIGPARTPYEDAPFFFDVHLPVDYPNVPPLFHYISFCSDRLNPNLYEDGNVCVSLLGTWDGKGKENWTSNSNLLQVLVSIQGLILVAEPYYNEAGYEKQKGSQQGHENSKTYNEMAVLKLVQSVTRMIKSPPHSFTKEFKDHLLQYGDRFVKRLEYWVSLSEGGDLNNPLKADETDVSSKGDNCQKSIGNTQESNSHEKPHATVDSCDLSNVQEDEFVKPDFPLLPASRGFCLTIKKHLEILKKSLSELGS